MFSSSSSSSGPRKPAVPLKIRAKAALGAANAAIHSRDDVRIPAKPTPVPEAGTDENTVRELIDKITFVPDDREPSSIGQHLTLLEGEPAKIKSKDPSHAGITTRAVWLDWEGQKHKILPPPQVKELPDFLLGKLYKKQQSSSDGFVLRDFRADMVPGTVTYSNKQDQPMVLWIVPGCIVQRLDGDVYGRRGCVRILWPNGYDLIVSGIEEEPTASTWYTFLCAMLMPTAAVGQSRLALTRNDRMLAALHRSAIRSQKWREPTPFGCTSAQLSKLALKIRSSACDRFDHLRDQVMFADLYAANLSQSCAGYQLWASGNPLAKYAELPEVHYAFIPSTTELSAAWETLETALPDRHQEELRRFFVDAGGDAARAERALRQHIAWRAANLPIRPQAISAALESCRCYVRGIDHCGNPLVHFVVSRHRPSPDKADKKALEASLKMCLYRLEQAIARHAMRDGKVSLLIRLDGAGAANRDLPLLAALCKAAAENYPERLHAAYLYPSASKPGIALGIQPTLLARVVPAADIAALRLLLPVASIPQEIGGEDGYAVADDVLIQSSGTLLPPLWAAGAEAHDYYPPPAPSPEWMFPAIPPDIGSAHKHKPVQFVCYHCESRVDGEIGVALVAAQCAICRFATGQDKYYAGWTPVSPTAYPEPSMENFLRLGLDA